MLRTEHVYKSFEKNNPLLERVCFSAMSGRVGIIAGETGAGKTTFLRLLRGEILPDSGRVWFGEQDTAKLTEKGRMQLWRKVAMVHEFDRLVADRTVIENVALPLRIQGVHGERLAKRVDALLARFGLTKLAYRFAGTLSAGQARYVVLARALAAWPQVLLADEPFSHLDRIYVQRLVRILLEHAEEDRMAVVIATHHLEFCVSERIDHWQIVGTDIVPVENAHENTGVSFSLGME